MGELVEWLRAQLDEDERIARAAAVEVGNPYENGVLVDPLDRWGEGLVADGQEWTPSRRLVTRKLQRDGQSRLTVAECGGSDGRPVANHIAAHDPARVLREIDAKRRLLALLPELEQADRAIEGEWGSSDDLAGKLLDALLTPYPKCGATAVFWPDDEGCEAVCSWPRGYGGTKHMDETLGSWDEAELTTSYPSE